MKTAKRTAKVQASTGNVFADLGLDNPEHRLAKAQLAHEICAAIAARQWTQTKAAHVMGLDQPKISALMRGKLKGFSADRLLRCLSAMGADVEIRIRPHHRNGRRGAIRVMAIANPG